MRSLVIILFGLSVAACASGGGGLATSAFDYAPTGAVPMDDRHGYELSGDGDWDGEVIYEDRPGGAQVSFAYTPAGGERLEADLEIAMPYLEGGRRRFVGEADDGRMVEVVLQAGPCREQAGGEYATHFAAVSVGGTQIAGCGYEVSHIDRWTNYLMDYMPAIDTCLGEFPQGAQHVTLAYPLSDGSTGVRIVDTGGARWECATRDEDSAVNSLRRLDAADAVFGEGDPVFVLGRMPELGEGCYVYEAVRAADGDLIGALGYDGCGGGGVPSS